MILEDDIYGQLAYDGSPLPTIKAQDEQNQVIYVSGFSKVLMPGLRIGYMVMPTSLRTRLQSLRRATDLCSPVFVQRALANFLRRGGLKQHLKRVIPIYRDRRDTLMSALQENMPPAVTWSRPAGGYSSWVTLPRYFAPGELYRQALQQGFAFTPGEAYQIDDASHEFMRLCFANQSAAGIRAGVKLLGNLIKQQINTGGRSSDWMPVV
jgi:DNA-binding transcriptional MocR family regulator